MATEPKFIDCTCPQCDAASSFLEDWRGMLQECPDCMEILVVPRESGGPAHRIPVPVTTPRLVLRRLQFSDGGDLLAFLSDEELFRFEGNGPFNEEQIQQWLEADPRARLTTPGTLFCLAIVMQSTNRVIGMVHFRLTDDSRSQARISVYMHRDFQKQGLATEAVKGVFKFGFEGIGLHRIVASCDSRNIAAGKLFEKAGMRREGEFIQDHIANDEWASTSWYAMLEMECRT
jgi:RimJ/RimL family protein N-acetyltransferase